MVPPGGDCEPIIGPLKHPCDLFVLIFFSRFPYVFLTNERLAQYVGYDEQQVARSVEILIGARVLSRSQNPNHEARLYLFTRHPLQEWVRQVLSVASTQEGRNRLLRTLKEQALPRRTDRSRRRNGSSSSSPDSSESGGFAANSEAIQWLTKTL
jgi:hypothetical protein